MFITKHPSRCFPSFVVVVVVVVVVVTSAATISDQHVLTIRGFASRQWFSECIRLISLTCNNIQLQVTKCLLLDSVTTNDVFANVSYVLQCLVFLQHFLLLSCHCRFVLEHQSSSLGNVIEFPSSYTLLESKRNTQLLRSIMQQAFANMTCVSTNVCLFSRSHLSCSFFQANLQPNQSTCTCNVSSDVCRAHVNTHLLFFTRYRPNLLSSCMCPLRGSFMCLVTHFTASAMSTLS